MSRAKKLLLLLLLLVLLLGVYTVISKWTSAEEEQDTAFDPIQILSFDSEDVDAVSWEFTGEGGRESYTLRKEDGEWIWPEDRELTLDQDLVEQMLNNIAELAASKQLAPEEPLEYETYGLDEKGHKITLHFTEESQTPEITLLTGDYNEIAAQYYAMIEGQEPIYLVEGAYMESYMSSPKTLQYIEDETSQSGEETDN